MRTFYHLILTVDPSVNTLYSTSSCRAVHAPPLTTARHLTDLCTADVFEHEMRTKNVCHHTHSRVAQSRANDVSDFHFTTQPTQFHNFRFARQTIRRDVGLPHISCSHNFVTRPSRSQKFIHVPTYRSLAFSSTRHGEP